MMRLIALTSVALVLQSGFSAARADTPEEPTFALTPQAEPAPELTYEEYRIEELERSARRSRNALIGTSAAAAVGLALVIPASASQCNSVEVDGESSYECTRAGDALLGVGSPLVVGGLTGALVSGIILGVRKGKLRRLNDSFSYPKSRAVRWDERRSLLAF
ncbi:MAG: hypothetical protein WBM46_03930 [Polyangiales bacterium]